jgi:hypothetical protein
MDLLEEPPEQNAGIIPHPSVMDPADPLLHSLPTQPREPVEPYEIESIEDYLAVIRERQHTAVQQLWFRGHGSTKYNLKPSLYRHPEKSNDIDALIELEYEIIQQFKHRGLPFLNRQVSSTVEWLFLMQHYGVPTRLLDWTENPLMALFFALTDCEKLVSKNERDNAAVWILNPGLWNSLETAPIGISSITSVDNALIQNYFQDNPTILALTKPVAVYGPHNSPRIAAQKGAFVVFGKDTTPMNEYPSALSDNGCIVKLSIAHATYRTLLKEVISLGISETSAFPDLEGLGREIKRQWGFSNV